MEYTTNYQLPTWVETDRIQMDDFNDMTDKIDTALGEQSEALAQQGATLDALLNGRVYVTQYTGTGTYGQGNPVALTMPGKPLLMFVTAGDHLMVYAGGTAQARVWYSGGGGGHVTTNWDGSQFSWYGTGGDQQMNSSGRVFSVMALYMAP